MMRKEKQKKFMNAAEIILCSDTMLGNMVEPMKERKMKKKCIDVMCKR